MTIKNKKFIFFSGLMISVIIGMVFGFLIFDTPKMQAETMPGGSYGGACICDSYSCPTNVLFDYCEPDYSWVCSGNSDFCLCECINTSQECWPAGECCQYVGGSYYSSPLGSPCSESYEEFCVVESGCGSGRFSDLNYKTCNDNGGCTGGWQSYTQNLPNCDTDKRCQQIWSMDHYAATCTYDPTCPPACYPSGIYKFSIQNSSGNGVAFIDDEGFLAANSVYPNRPNLSPPAGSFIIKDSNNNAVAYFNSSGSLYLKGNLNTSQASLNPSGSGNFIIQNPAGAVVAYFDSAGNLYLKECSASFSLDYDGDGFTVGTGDCYDDNASVKPGQTEYFYTSYGDNQWDYNCSGDIEKSLLDYYTPEVNYHFIDSCDKLSSEECASDTDIYYTTDLAESTCSDNIIYTECAWTGDSCDEFQRTNFVVCH